jgi:DNA-binding IclR family transcriptional regulator
MEKLASKTKWSINLGILGRLEVVYIDTLRLDGGNFLKPDIGSSRPLLTTSIGRALLLASPPADQKSVLNRLKLTNPVQFKKDIHHFYRDQEFYDRNGYCLSRGDWEQDVYAVAVPLRVGRSEDLVIALNCTLSGTKITQAEINKTIIPNLLEAKRNIERDSGNFLLNKRN